MRSWISLGGPLEKTDLKATLESFSATQNQDGQELFTPPDLADVLYRMRLEGGSLKIAPK
jgi:hypothetical protein